MKKKVMRYFSVLMLFVLISGGVVFADENISDNPAVIEVSKTERLFNFEQHLKNLFVQGITAKSYIVVDVQTGATVLSHNINYTQNPASITKLMTAIILLESGEDLQQNIIIGAGDIGIEPVNMDLLEDEVITLQNVFEGMLIASGNDAANTIGRFVAGSTSDFVAMMNQKARALGLDHTHFENPIGFDGEFQYSSAADVARLSWYAMQFPEIRDIVSTSWKTVSSVDGRITHVLSTTNALLRNDDIIGTKTGYTEDAGECVSIYVKSDEYEYIIVVLGSEDRFADASVLLEYSQVHMKNVETSFPTIHVDVFAPLFGSDLISIGKSDSEIIAIPDFMDVLWGEN